MESRPTRLLQDPREILKTHIRGVAEGTVTQLKGTALTYRVTGGPPGKRLSTIIKVSGLGPVTYEHRDEIQGKRTSRAKFTLPNDEVRSLFQQVQESGVLEQRDVGTGFLPDSVIGSITIESAEAEITYYFLAEERHQKFQQKVPTPSLQRLIAVFQNLTEQGLRRSGPKSGNQSGTTKRR